MIEFCLVLKELEPTEIESKTNKLKDNTSPMTNKTITIQSLTWYTISILIVLDKSLCGQCDGHYVYTMITGVI